MPRLRRRIAGALGRALRVDLRRSVCAPLFFFTVLLLFSWLVFNSGKYLNSEMYRRTNCMAEILNYTLTGTLTLAELVLAIAAVTYGWSYSRDRACGFFSQAVARVGTPAYSVARAVSVALSAFLAGVVALGLYLLFLTTLHVRAVLRDPDPHRRPDLQLCGGVWPDGDGLLPQCLYGAFVAGSFVLFSGGPGASHPHAAQVVPGSGDVWTDT